MASTTYTVAKVYTTVSPAGRGVRLEVQPCPPGASLIITDMTDADWVLYNAAYGQSVTVTTDPVSGNRTGVSRP
jgi:hypothetical protein